MALFPILMAPANNGRAALANHEFLPMTKTASICTFGLLFSLSLLPALQAQDEPQFLVPLIKWNPNGELTMLQASCRNNTDAPLYLSYRLSVQQKGPAAALDELHEGDFDLLPRKEKLLFNAQLNLSPEDRLHIILHIFSNGQLVASDSLRTKARTKQTPAAPPALRELAEAMMQAKRQTPSSTAPTHSTTPEVVDGAKPPTASIPHTSTASNSPDRIVAPDESIGIDGLVIDDTRTKMAHDFYDLFYRKWIAPQSARDFIIYVKELPARGRLARVAIVVNDDEVIQRILSPRADVVEQQVDYSIRALTRHLEKQAQVKDQLGQEDVMGSGIF